MSLPARDQLNQLQQWDPFRTWLQQVWDHTATLPYSNKAKGIWTSGSAYAAGDYVLYEDAVYLAQANHVAGSFAEDRAAGRWMFLDAALAAAISINDKVAAVESQAAQAETVITEKVNDVEGIVVEAVEAAVAETAENAAAVIANKAAFEDRVYPGVYSTPPSNKPNSGAASADGDRCTILVSGVPYEHLRVGGGWVIPNIEAVNLALPDGLQRVGFRPAGINSVPSDAERKARERVSFFDFFTPEEKADALSGAPELDHTASMQKAIDDSPAGTTIKGAAQAFFNFKALLSPKDLTLDFEGARMRVDPTPPGVTTGTPAIRFVGQRGTGYSITTKTALTSEIQLANPADASNFSAGDWVVIEDNLIIDKWDGSGPAYSGRGQITRIRSLSAGVLNLSQAVEHLYDGATAKVYKTTPLVGPQILNIGSITEVDPGGVTSGSVEMNAPHLIEFAYCLRPKVSAVSAKQFNLFVIHFAYCVQQSAKRVFASDAFRPSNGGHGYLTRFYRCLGGTTKNSRGERIRHVVDYTNTYDGVSENNLAVDCLEPSFFAHGLASRRCKSIHDTVLNPTLRAAAGPGWGVGNTAFREDYDFEIISPTYRGGSDAVLVRSRSQNTRISNPDFKCTDNSGGVSRGVLAQEGANNTEITGGVIDMSEMGDVNCLPVLARDTGSVPTGNISVKGVRLIAPNGGGGVIFGEITGGGVLAVGNKIEGVNSGASRAIDVNAAAQYVHITDNQLSGTWLRGIRVAVAPTLSYVVGNNSDNGTVAQFLDLAQGANLVSFLNGRNAGNTLALNGMPGTTKQFELRTANVLRWVFRSSSAADNLDISRRADDGSSLGSAVAIVRATGQINLEAGGNYLVPLKIGAYYIWIDVSGRMRIKNSPPASEADGTVVGSQA